jgi:hypothetical protein
MEIYLGCKKPLIGEENEKNNQYLERGYTNGQFECFIYRGTRSEEVASSRFATGYWINTKRKRATIF